MTHYPGADGTIEVVEDDSGLQFEWSFDRSPWDERHSAVVMAALTRDGMLRVFPKTRSGETMSPQFSQIGELRLEAEGLSEWEHDDLVGEGDGGYEVAGLPDGFSRTFRWGLGVRRRYRGVLHAIEDHTDCTIVEFGSLAVEGVDGAIFRMNLSRFLGYKRTVDRNYDRGETVVSRVNRTESRNAVADLVGLEVQKPIIGRHPVIQAMTRELIGEPFLDADDRRLLIQQVSSESRAAAAEAPVEFGQLRKDIELVSLEVLIQQFETGLSGGQGKDEDHWQDFFEKNVFALQQLFAAPVVLYRSQMFVKSGNIGGQGARIADFVLVNALTRSALVVEIKTPAAKLTGSKYRGTGGAEVFPPHKELAGAVGQVQAQIESVRLHLPILLAQTPGAEELNISVVRGAVIIGMVGSLPTEEESSFGRYRDGLAAIEVVAFDEVLARLKGLQDLLAQPPAGV